MTRHYFLPTLALAGLAVAAAVAWLDEVPAQPNRPPLPAASSPFNDQLVGTGIVEANGGNVAIGTPVAGIVKRVAVRWGDHVCGGDVLFQIDDADLQSHLPLAEARVREAQARLAMSRNALALVEHVPDRRAVSTEEVDNRRLAAKIDEAAVATARAGVEEIMLEEQRRIVHAPVVGQVLQIRTHPGEYVDGTTPLLLVGDDSRRQVRVDVGEYDAGRLRPGAPAVANLRDDPVHRVTLKFERIEPLVVPKAALTGASTERVDTRVLQVIYSFDAKDLPAYVGQQLDVYIDASVRQARAGMRTSAKSERGTS